MRVLRIRCHCGRNLADCADPQGLDVFPRPGVRSWDRHDPAPYVVTFSWTCPECRRPSQLRAERIAAAYDQHRRDARRVVPVVVGRDI